MSFALDVSSRKFVVSNALLVSVFNLQPDKESSMKARIAFALFALLMVAAVAALRGSTVMQAARADLQTAKSQLQQANADKQGHRVKPSRS